MAGNTASHGLGLTFGAVGFATCVGDILGGSLSENKKTLACVICGGFMLLALLSLQFLGWKETAPGVRRRRQQQQRGGGVGSDDDRNGCERVDEEEGNAGGSGSVGYGNEEAQRRLWMGNAGLRPFDRVSILKVLVGSRYAAVVLIMVSYHGYHCAYCKRSLAKISLFYVYFSENVFRHRSRWLRNCLTFPSFVMVTRDVRD